MLKNLKLNTTILIALFIGLALPMFVTTIYLQNKYEKELKNELVKTHEKLLKTLSSGLSRPMWEFMYDNAKSLVEPVYKNEDILEIKVTDIKYNNNVFLQMRKNEYLTYLECKESQKILIEENVILEKLILGKVSILFSTCRIEGQILQQKKSLWLLMVAQFFISFGVIFLLIQAKILNPIKRLINQSNQLAKKNLNKPFVWKSADEIGHLGESLEYTRLSLVNLFKNERKSQEQIKDLNKDLECKITQRTSELLMANLELEKTIEDLNLTQEQLIYSEKMASLGNLVAGIAHEINTPIGVGLTGITHFIDITKEINELYTHKDISQEEFEEYLMTSLNLANSINKNLRKAADLIKSFKKISVDQSSEEKRKFNLCEYMNEFITSMYGTLSKTKVETKIDIDSNIIINSYPGSYAQFLTILLMNSLLHGFEDAQSGLIRFSAKKSGDSIILCYCDNGKGIANENLKYIFDPFFTTKKGTGGSGLGLNILYNIVVGSLKGNVICESEMGVGTKFIITLPIES